MTTHNIVDFTADTDYLITIKVKRHSTALLEVQTKADYSDHFMEAIFSDTVPKYTEAGLSQDPILRKETERLWYIDFADEIEYWLSIGHGCLTPWDSGVYTYSADAIRQFCIEEIAWSVEQNHRYVSGLEWDHYSKTYPVAPKPMKRVRDISDSGCTQKGFTHCGLISYS